jgi:hypothetical protein
MQTHRRLSAAHAGPGPSQFARAASSAGPTLLVYAISDSERQFGEARHLVFVAASAERVSMLRDFGLGDSEGLLVTPSAGGCVRPVKALSGLSGCGKFLHSGRLLIAHFGQWFRRASGEANY